MKYVNVMLQILFFILFAQGCRFISEYFHLPVPGAIIGIIILFTLLKLKVIKLQWIDLGAKLLIAEMMLFFVPSIISIINYKQLVMEQGLLILFIIIASTLTVMLTSGLTSEWMSKRKEGGI